MKQLQFFISTVVLILLAVTAQAQPVSQESLDKLLILSGIDAQAKGAARGAEMMFSQSPLGQVESPKIKQLQSSLTDYNRLIDGASQSLKAALTEAQAKKLLSWYEGNFGNRVARAEEAGSSPEAMQSAMQNAQSLLADAERVAVTDKLIAQMGVVEESVDLQKALTNAIFAGMSSVQSPDKAVDLAGIEAMVSAQIASAKPQMEQHMRIMILNTYKDFSVAELESYTEVLERPEMKTFNQAGIEGLLNVMVDAVQQLVAQDSANI